MNFKKRVNGSWTDTPNYIYNTSTDTITTLPADLYADGNNATVGLKGNMSQSGTPSPSSIIMPQECGDLETTGEHAGQYKIPISSANNTTPVYLGEVESARRIKKYEFTGDETFYADITYNRFWTTVLSDMFYVGNRLTPMYCDRYTVVDDGRSIDIVPNNSCYTTVSNLKRYYIQSTDYVSETDLQSYLAAQYAAGTPVTVWYVLATPTTGIVNEPIRKIGDYADTVSGITIPTITGKDTFDVETTLKPSEVSLAYTGWHDASVKEWDGSEWD